MLATFSVAAGAVAQSVDTPAPEVDRLQGALLQYQTVSDNGGWPTVPAGPTIEPGSNDPRVAALATRLQATCDLVSRRDTWTEYDDELQAAVLGFQVRHGLEPDALVGKATLRALNVPARQRVDQLATNLERARQVYENPQPDFLLVNIPAFEAYLVRDGKTAWKAKVVVGEAETETPVFEAELSQVVLNPDWTVPRSIASEDLLPKIQANAEFLARGGYELFESDGTRVNPSTVDWTALHENNFPYTLVQRPGPQNELGQVKFLFPNPFGVCMHDTPKKQLLSHTSRAYSHGCIRVDQPLGLANRLLELEGWVPEQVAAHLVSGQTQSIRLAKPLPFVVTYLTAWVDESGTVFFYRDIYGRD